MRPHTLVIAAPLLLACAVSVADGRVGVQKPQSAGAMRAEIEALRPARVAWRGIAWKSCLLDGLRESRAKGKPVLLWVFIDRPTDDARC